MNKLLLTAHKKVPKNHVHVNRIEDMMMIRTLCRARSTYQYLALSSHPIRWAYQTRCRSCPEYLAEQNYSLPVISFSGQWMTEWWIKHTGSMRGNVGGDLTVLKGAYRVTCQGS